MTSELTQALSKYEGLLTWVTENSDILGNFCITVASLYLSGELFDTIGRCTAPDPNKFIVDTMLKVKEGMPVKPAIISTLKYYREEGIINVRRTP